MTQEAEKVRRVVGIAYSQGEGVPRVVLKGAGSAAETIRTEFGKTKASHRIVEDEALLEKLFRLPTDSEISPDLYELVAILLVHVYAVEARLKEAM